MLVRVQSWAPDEAAAHRARRPRVVWDAPLAPPTDRRRAPLVGRLSKPSPMGSRRTVSGGRFPVAGTSASRDRGPDTEDRARATATSTDPPVLCPIESDGSVSGHRRSAVLTSGSHAPRSRPASPVGDTQHEHATDRSRPVKDSVTRPWCVDKWPGAQPNLGVLECARRLSLGHSHTRPLAHSPAGQAVSAPAAASASKPPTLRAPPWPSPRRTSAALPERPPERQ